MLVLDRIGVRRFCVYQVDWHDRTDFKRLHWAAMPGDQLMTGFCRGIDHSSWT